MSVIPNGGLNNSTRIKIEFADDAVKNTWFRVTILANANTSVASNDVFYFGSAADEMNVGNLAGPPVASLTYGYCLEPLRGEECAHSSAFCCHLSEKLLQFPGKERS